MVACRPRVAARLLGSLLAVSLAASAGVSAQQASASAVTAAYLLNFARFATYPPEAQGSTVVICVTDDARVLAALQDTVRDQRVGAAPVVGRALNGGEAPSACHVWFVGREGLSHWRARQQGLADVPVLTVSDAPGFQQAGGMLELVSANGRIRFRVNLRATTRAGLQLNARLLALAMDVGTRP